MKIEEIIKLLWRRKIYILIPAFIVPMVAIYFISKLTREYESSSLVYIHETSFKHPTMQAFGLKMDLKEQLLTIKKLMKGEDELLRLLGEKKPKKSLFSI